MVCNTERKKLRFASVYLRQEFCNVHSQRFAQDLASGPRLHSLPSSQRLCALPNSSQGFQTQFISNNFATIQGEAQEMEKFRKIKQAQEGSASSWAILRPALPLLHCICHASSASVPFA